MAFRFQGQCVFLTYAQAERIEDKQELVTFLQGRGQPNKILVAQEFHEDGGIHYHAIVSWETRRDIRDVRYFDLRGVHPNMQVTRKIKDVLRYVTKDGDFTNIGWTLPKPEKEDVFTALREEMALSNDATKVIQATIARTGTAGLRMYNNVAAYVDRMSVPDKVFEPMRDWILAFPALEAAALNAVTQFVEDVAVGYGPRDARKSLWLWGPSRMGKTELGRSLGTHWYMNTAWNVDCYSDNAEYGVLDDIEWPALQRYYRGIMGLQRDVTVTDKYRKKSVIAGGKPVLILSNELPVFTVQEALWLEANVNFVHIGARLF
uniref:Replication-associated protein n=1 Tax=Red panda feces-associated genomovirus TaxID=2863991 RepID=A0A8K1HHV2_9VIRU|nr:replication-associated protein [Red panda feces-associated genomovirus]